MEKLNKNDKNDNELSKLTIEDWIEIKDKIIENELVGRYLQPLDTKIFNKKEVVVFLLNFMGLCISEKNLDLEITKDTTNFLASGLRLSHELLSIAKNLHDYIFSKIKQANEKLLYIPHHDLGYETPDLFKVFPPFKEDKYLLFKTNMYEEKIGDVVYDTRHITSPNSASISSYNGKNMKLKMFPALNMFFINIYEFRHKLRCEYESYNRIGIGLNVVDHSIPVAFHHELILDLKSEFSKLGNLLRIKRIIESLCYEYIFKSSEYCSEEYKRVFYRIFFDDVVHKTGKIIPIKNKDSNIVDLNVLFKTQDKLLKTNTAYNKAISKINEKEDNIDEDYGDDETERFESDNISGSQSKDDENKIDSNIEDIKNLAKKIDNLEHKINKILDKLKIN